MTAHKCGGVKLALCDQTSPLIYLYDISGDMIKMTDISSCVIVKCLNDATANKYYYTNCNETANAFFCKQGI
jgi:hypothetical protein